MTYHDESLRLVLDELAGIASAQDAPRVHELQRRLTSHALRVLVAGEAKRGKSTLINALLGRDVLPSGAVPLTAIVTTVVYGTEEGAAVRMLDGSTVLVSLAELGTYVTESENPLNERGVAEVTVSVRSPLLAGGVELVDTPGTGSVYRHNTAEAVTALERMDAAVVVLTADPPVSATEMELVDAVRDSAVTVFYVLNKIDRLSPDQVAEAQAFTEQALSAAGGAATVWPMSALAALNTIHGSAADSAGYVGFETFAAAFTRYLSESSNVELRRSVTARACAIATSIAETHRAALSTLTVSASALQAALTTFEDRLIRVEEERTETRALCQAALGQLLEETNTAADAVIHHQLKPLLSDVQSFLKSAEGSAAERERDTLAHTTHVITSIVDEWRTRWDKRLDHELTSLDSRLGTRLDQHIAAVRQAAVSLLNVDLPPHPSGPRLIAHPDFRYRFSSDPGQYDAMAAALRHRLPAGWTRRALERYVLRRAADLLDRQVGRARSDYQSRLAQAQGQLRTSLQSRYDQGAGEIARAITAAAQARQDSEATAEQLRRQATASIMTTESVFRQLRALCSDKATGH